MPTSGKRQRPKLCGVGLSSLRMTINLQNSVKIAQGICPYTSKIFQKLYNVHSLLVINLARHELPVPNFTLIAATCRLISTHLRAVKLKTWPSSLNGIRQFARRQSCRYQSHYRVLTCFIKEPCMLYAQHGIAADDKKVHGLVEKYHISWEHYTAPLYDHLIVLTTFVVELLSRAVVKLMLLRKLRPI